MKKLLIPFIIIQLLIIIFVYIFESILNINFDFSWIHYSVIIIDLIYALLYIILSKVIKIKDKEFYLFLSFVSTLIADFGLIILNDYFQIFLVFFIYTQLFYFLYLYKNINKPLFVLLINLFILTLNLILTLCKLESYNYIIYGLTLIYISLFIYNIIRSILNKENKIFIIGLILFLLCDICVGLNALELFDLKNDLIFRLIWVFYLPSQVLITYYFLNKIIKKLQ